MYDEIIETRIHKEREEFIDSIKDQICALASTYHNGDDCEFFRDFNRGSYNVCFFVQFFQHSKLDRESGAKPDGDRWVVRVPLGPCLAMEPWEKVETEVATMQFVASRTTIPIPKIHGCSTARVNGPHGIASFMILEYVDGKTLDELGLDLKKGIPVHLRHKLNVQLADVYVQLSRLEFPAIGRLVPGPRGSVRVGRMPISNAMNQQQLEVMGVLDMVEKGGGSTGLTSANHYVSLLLDIAFNLFENSRANCRDEADARRRLYFLHQFSSYVQEKWVKSAPDRGPFVLAHGDLQKWNLIVSDDLDLLAVIDWEWAQTVPLQLFLPPLWLSGSPIWVLGYRYEKYVERLRELCSVIEEVEKDRYGEASLSRNWTDLSEGGGILVSMALQYPPNIEEVMRGYLDVMIHCRTSTRDVRIQQFIDEDPSRGDLVARKLAAWASYDVEMKRLSTKKSCVKARKGC